MKENNDFYWFLTSLLVFIFEECLNIGYGTVPYKEE